MDETNFPEEIKAKEITMACPTCDGTFESCAQGIFHCGRCGTMKIVRSEDHADVYVPKLVARCRAHIQSVKAASVKDSLRQLGLVEAVFPPSDRPF